MPSKSPQASPACRRPACRLSACRLFTGCSVLALAGLLIAPTPALAGACSSGAKPAVSAAVLDPPRGEGPVLIAAAAPKAQGRPRAQRPRGGAPGGPGH